MLLHSQNSQGTTEEKQTPSESLCQFSAVSGSIGILTYLFFVTATIEDIKKVLEEQIRLLRSKLLSIEEKFDTLQNLVDFMSAKYDELLKQIQGSTEKVVTLISDVKNLKRDFVGTQKRTQLIESMSCIELVKALGKDMQVDLKDDDISTAHPIPRYDKSADKKIIVKFTRRDDRDEFYSNRKKVLGRKANSLKCLKDASATKGVDLNKKIYISESLTPTKKKLFGSVNKLKKKHKWKFIWSNHGRIYFKKGEDMQTHKIDSLGGFENFKKNILKGPRG